MITVWELVREASEVLTSLDSRLWRTLALLMFRPGALTWNYLEGRRARYVAPLRLFIAASVIFFFTAAVTADFSATDEGLQITLDPESGEMAGEGAAGTVTGENAPGESPVTDARPAAGGETGAPETESPTDPAAAPDDAGVPQEEANADNGGNGFDCDSADLEVNLSGPEWLKKYLTEARIRATCHKIVDDRGASLAGALMENIPVMMFVFLPFMAGVMKLVYPLSGRYYVEHLLFLVHYHSFFYLLTTAVMVTGWLGGRWIMPEWPGSLLTVVALVYPPVYLYRAMRKVYGQSRLVTAIKYILLFVAYFVFLVVTFLGTLTITALTL